MNHWGRRKDGPRYLNPARSVQGSIGNSLSTYPERLNLKMRVVLQSVGTRPLFVVEDEHWPADAQQNGISRDEGLELFIRSAAHQSRFQSGSISPLVEDFHDSFASSRS